MSFKKKSEGMYKILNDIRERLWSDEELLRQLSIYPKSRKNKDPLDPSRKNIVVDINNATEEEINLLWSIRDTSFKTVPDTTDLEDKQICCLFIYADERRPTNSYKIADQIITIDVFCHKNYEKDFRTAQISDRINELLVTELKDGNPVSGMGMIRFNRGIRLNILKDYSTYRNTYIVGAK